MFYLNNGDLVLSITLLNMIGCIWFDWNLEIMWFRYKGKWVEIKGVGKNVEELHTLQEYIGDN